jgi:carboxylesterase type B
VPGCQQVCPYGPLACPAITSNDCLYLTITAPSQKSNDGYPVMIWIHGGFNLYSAGSVPLYNGAVFAANGVITVTVNYRIGFLGFFAAPDLGIEGNFGFLDQRLAMKWVKKNIEAFGGNPNKITIAGQSSGAGSVYAHLCAPGSAGLFSAAVRVQSYKNMCIPY